LALLSFPTRRSSDLVLRHRSGLRLGGFFRGGISLLACLHDTRRGSSAAGSAARDAVGCGAVLIAQRDFGAACWFVARAVALAAPDPRVVFRSVHSRNGFSEPHRTDYAPLWRIVGAAGSNNPP